MATKTKKPVSRAVVGSTKKTKSSKVITKRMALFGIVGVLAFSTIAGLGWQKWQEHQFRAKAAGWTVVNGFANSPLLACKIAINSAYGPLWKITLVLANGSGVGKFGGFYVERGSGIVSTVNLPAYPGQWIVRETYASRVLGDTYSTSYAEAGRGGGGPFTQRLNYNTITGC